RQLVCVRQQLEPRIARPGNETLTDEFDALGPFLSLQRAQVAAFLKIADQNNLAPADCVARLLLCKYLAGANQRLIQTCCRPARFCLCQAAARERDAIRWGRCFPLVERNQWR